MEEALGLAVGFRRVGFGVDMADVQGLAKPVEGLGAATRAVVRHPPLSLHAEAFTPGHHGYQEGQVGMGLCPGL